MRVAWIASALVALMVVQALAAGVAPHPEWENGMPPQGKPGPMVTLAEDGRTAYTILLPERARGPEQKAAEDLAHWLGEMTGATFAIVREGGAPLAGDRWISVGRTRLRADMGLPRPALDLGRDGYAIQVAGRSLFITGGDRRGILNGVYSLLQEELGCRWYLPGTDPVIPKRATLRFRPVVRAYRPAFEDRREPYYGDVAYDAEWSIHNRTYGLSANVPESAGGYPRCWPGMVHTYDALLSPGEYFEAHPEYFSELAGKRQPFQLCTTNPDVRRIIIDKVLAALRADPGLSIIEVSPNDRRDYCECAECKAIDDAEGTKMGTLMTLINLVADAVRDEFPHVRISTLAYLDTVVPPKTIRPRDNVRFWLCVDAHSWSHPNLFVWETSKFSESMIGWEAIGGQMVIWDYPSSFVYMEPNLNLHVVAENVRWFAEHGATGMFYQCMHNWNRAADHSYLRGWVWAQQAWEPSLDTDALVRDFNYGFYGAAAEPMQAYDDMLQQAWEEWRRHRDEVGYRGPVTPAFADEGLALMARALDLARGDAELTRRVEIARLPLLFVKLQAGREGDAAAYSAMIDEFEKAARAGGAQWIENAFQAPDLDTKLTYWREKARLDASKLHCQALGNEWRFRPDPGDVGTGEKWFAPDLDDSGWAKVRSDAETGWGEQGFAGHHGYGWYRQAFEVTPEALGQAGLRLFFGAVDEQAWVYINGELAFEHTVASTGLPVETLWTTPFGFDPKPFLKPGVNDIAVRVHDTIGMAGIWRPVTLIWGEADYSPMLLWELVQEKTAGE